MTGLGHWYVEIEKQAYWRGAVKVFRNRYVLSGSDPVGSDATAVIGILKGIEDKVYPETTPGAGQGFVLGRAYASTGGPPIAIVDYNSSLAPGTATGYSGPGVTPGYTSLSLNATLEVCLGVTMPLSGLSTRGKPVHCRKFFRGIGAGSAGGEAGDSTQLPAGDIAIVENIVKPWQTGMGTNNWVVIGRSGRQASGPPTTDPFIINHQVPRGKKRKAVAAAASSSSLLSDVQQLAQIARDIAAVAADA